MPLKIPKTFFLQISRVPCLFLLATLSCEPGYDEMLTSPTVLPATIVVVLNPAADSQYVVITTGTPPPGEFDKLYTQETQLLARAEVTLEVNDRRLSFCKQNFLYRTEMGLPKFYWISTDPVLPGETCALTVNIPQKGRFTAATTVPGDFRILTPAENDTIDIEKPLRVHWTPAANAAGYRLTLIMHEDYSWYQHDDTTLTVSRHWSSAGAAWFAARPELPVEFTHRLADYFKEYYDPSTTKILSIKLAVEALDEPGWTAHQLETARQQVTSLYRLDVVDFSNVEGGHGLVTATNTQTVVLQLPEEINEHQ